MTSAGFSIMQFTFMSFWSVLMSNSFTQPNYTDLIRLTEAMLMCETELDVKSLEEVHYIYDHTNDEIDFPLGQLEFLVFYQINIAQAGLNKEVEINNKSWKIIDLYGFLDKTNQKLVRIVIGISKRYNLDIPLGFQQTSKLQY